ncbi:GNAT family N-acetyltransferase [Maritimibacter sp. HL-12]|jgi:RimJ/RimL family protein N-acetyltransferase|uniref:GNAT family N-acetyltransferase n=1 Tax=Maritimibacter sp. HL-12 TaxID=1162418 RepID=UPI000A0EEFE1|nr:GNAT family N-acetyltransferase [Maritimibacter sp. HL-12]SMH50801.1 Protein N-acetyltransferase, RimJ/RimL family [Maritimibacter sp. HL-12]
MISATVPVLTTARLTLRAPCREDFGRYATLLASERSRGIGGPAERPAAWSRFAAELGHWVLRGYGLWAVDVTETGETVGQVGFWHPEGWSEVEIGWMMFDGGEGKGYAHEAALAARAHAYEDWGWGPLTSVIAPGNRRSEALARRLGAWPEREWSTPGGARTVIWRHPGREALA